MFRRHIYLTLIFAFLLGSHDGFVALWREPNPEPVYISPYKVTSLPREDQRKLEQGIRIESMDELLILLEDYLS